MISLKASVRVKFGVTVARFANAAGGSVEIVVGIENGGWGAFGLTAIRTRGRRGSTSPAGPVAMFRVTSSATTDAEVGAVTRNSARAAGGKKISVNPVTGEPTTWPSCELVGTPSKATTVS